jgi:hypothetical protein
VKRTDKFLIGIVVAIVLLVIAALIVTQRRPEVTYQADDSPKGVAHNYLLALQRNEYARAYGYLSPTLSGYPPSEGDFAAAVLRERWAFRREEDVTLAVEEQTIAGNRAVVTVRETRFFDDGLFDASSDTMRFDVSLRREEAGWRIVGADAYFAPCWLSDRGCPP